MSDLVIGSCLRILTHPRVFDPPTPGPRALAIEPGSEWITTDRDYAQFPGLRWRHPLE